MEAVLEPPVAKVAAPPRPPPGVQARAVPHVRRDAAVTGAFFILFAVIILQKVAIPLGSGGDGGRVPQLHASVPIFAMVLAWLAIQGRVRVDVVQLGLLGLFFAACLPTMLGATGEFSVASFFAPMIL